MKTLALAAALALGPLGAACAQEVVRLATEGAFPPFNFINDASELAGVDIDLGRALCERAGLSCTWVQKDCDSIIPNLLSGNYDVIMAAMNITSEREEVIDFTQQYFPATPSVYVALSEEADLVCGTVAAQANTIHAAHVAGSGAALFRFSTPEETVAAVRDGEANAAFADRDFLAPIVDASGGELMVAGEPVPLGQGFGMGLRESDDALTAQFDGAIAAMKTDGSLDALLSKWFGGDAPPY